MQPDPSVFLRGIRHELLETGGEKLGEGDFVKGVTLLRGGEVTAHLLLRVKKLPGLLAGFRARQLALLEQSSSELKRLGIAIPAEANVALHAKPEVDGEAIIGQYDALVSAQAQCLYALSGQGEKPGVAETLNRLLQQSCELEQEVRDARSAALDAIRAVDTGKKADVDTAVPTDEIVTDHLRRHFPQFPDLRAVNVRQQKGVNTKEVFFMELHGHPDWPQQAVMRRNREVDTVGNEVSSEYGILDYVYRNNIPVPRPLFAGPVMGDQKRPFVVLGKLEGRAQSAAELGDSARDVLLHMARNLAALHRVDVRGMSDEYRTYGKAGTSARERTLKMLDRFYALWQGDKCEPSMTTEAAYIWLRENAGMLDETVTIVHADYSLRNNLAHERKIGGILDWELAHEGHPGEDLGYVRLDVEGVIPWAEFMQAYLDAGGVPVSDDVIRYFRIYGLAFIMASLYPACNGYLIGRHSDMLIGAAGTIEYAHYESMLGRLLLAEYK